MEDLTGRQLGPYRVMGPLGRGGMAAVYRAFQPGVDRYVALKILPREHADDPQFVARFQREARVIASLEHPNIVPVYDFGEDQGFTYLAMRFVEGGTLADLMESARLTMPQICKVVGQVGEALSYAHRRGVTHRDVKPTNVLIEATGNALLSDFGLAKIVEASVQLTATGGILGTPAYMSPEQALGRASDGRSDLYALGVILFELTTGRLPFSAETPVAVLMKHLHDPLPLPRSLNPDIPEPVEAVILKALAKDPEDRQACASDLVAALRASVPGLAEQASVSELPTRLHAPPPAEHAEMSPRPARSPARNESAFVQVHQRRRVGRNRWGAYALLAVATLFGGSSLLGATLWLLGRNPQYPPLLGVAYLAGAALVVLLARQLLRRARAAREALAGLVEAQGNHHCCPCGRPAVRYYWVHYAFCALPPWGLIALFFKLKRCPGCGRPYDARLRAAL